jgi:hypothetical protein
MWRGASGDTPQRGEQLSFAERFLDEVDAGFHHPLGVQDSRGVARHEQHRRAGPERADPLRGFLAELDA